MILVPGPEHEINNVKLIYDLFINHKMEESKIAKLLNEKGVLTDLGRKWTRGTVHQVLSNEKYIGNNVYNKTSFKLKNERVKNPTNKWVRCNDAFTPIINKETFYTAQGMFLQRNKKYSEEEMLERLKDLFKQHGKVSAIIIDERNDMPSSSVYRRQFGSLINAYRLVGYSPDRDFRYIEINKRLRKYYSETVDHIFKEIESLAYSIELDSQTGAANCK